MVLKNQVEWALHCCAILAGLPQGTYLAGKDLAELHGVPRDYLAKALQALSLAGLVETTLGPRGGYRLAKSPTSINFLDIVEAIEGDRSMFVCSEIRRKNPCRPKKTRDAAPCAIARVMYDADEAWRASLRGVTLADLLKTLTREIDPVIWQKTGEWVLART